MNRILLLSILSYCLHTSAQYYLPPVDIPIQLSGTFAELRGTHFHAGVDIRTQSKEGLPVRAVADGYVSRIKIQQGGYGKALYINHPDGNTSVYAHLKRYSDKVVPFVRKKQYANKSYNTDFYLDPTKISVKKGEVIGFSGNTGSSFGPHLHFELRNSANQIPFNPMMENIDVTDTHRPIIKQVFAYPVRGVVNQSEEKIQLSFTQKNDSLFVSEPVVALGDIGFGMEHFDRQNGSYNKNGTFEVLATLNGKKRFLARFDTLSFDDTKHMHKLLDYSHYVDTNKKVMLFFNSYEDAVPFVDFFENGLLHIEEGKSYTYKVTLRDVAVNSTHLIVPIIGQKEEVWVQKKPPQKGKMIQPKRDYLFEFDSAELYFQANTFSKATPLDIFKTNDTLHIENSYAYFNKPYKLTFEKKDTIKGEYLALKQHNDWKFVTKRNFKGNFTTSLKKTGKIAVLQDTIPPTITDQKNISNRWISLEKDIRFTVKDFETGIDKYEGYLNNKWILFEYEQKKNELIFRFNDPVKLSQVKHKLQLIVWDKAGNNTTFETTFYRKE